MDFLFFEIFYLFIFRERGREGEREREKHQCVIASCSPPSGDTTWPTTHTCTLTGNWTCNPLVCRPMLNPLSHTSQGWNGFSYLYFTDRGDVSVTLNSLTKVTWWTSERPNIQPQFFWFQSLTLQPDFLLRSTSSLVLFLSLFIRRNICIYIIWLTLWCGIIV